MKDLDFAHLPPTSYNTTDDVRSIVMNPGDSIFTKGQICDIPHHIVISSDKYGKPFPFSSSRKNEVSSWNIVRSNHRYLDSQHIL